MSSKLHAVVYRTGGFSNYRWHRAASTTARHEAEEQRLRLRAMGYAAHLVEFTAAEGAPALPTTFEHAPFRRLNIAPVQG